MGRGRSDREKKKEPSFVGAISPKTFFSKRNGQAQNESEKGRGNRPADFLYHSQKYRRARAERQTTGKVQTKQMGNTIMRSSSMTIKGGG